MRLSKGSTYGVKPAVRFQQKRSCRALGHAAFRSTMLARYGTVVTVPYKPANTNVKRLAHVVKEAVEAKTGLPLDSFRR
ncbi:hypothetical protein ABBQ38_013572 [Trebouxia sp. C0009 RCD-2024]